MRRKQFECWEVVVTPVRRQVAKKRVLGESLASPFCVLSESQHLPAPFRGSRSEPCVVPSPSSTFWRNVCSKNLTVFYDCCFDTSFVGAVFGGGGGVALEDSFGQAQVANGALVGGGKEADEVCHV